MMCPDRSRALVGVTSRPVWADSHGKRAPAWPAARRRHGGGEPSEAVLEHGPGRSRMRRGQEGQDEGIGVPEHVTPVARPRQASGADRRLPGVSDRGHQVEEREADTQLQLVVSLDDHIGVLPPTRPSLAMLG